MKKGFHRFQIYFKGNRFFGYQMLRIETDYERGIVRFYDRRERALGGASFSSEAERIEIIYKSLYVKPHEVYKKITSLDGGVKDDVAILPRNLVPKVENKFEDSCGKTVMLLEI